MFFGILVSVLRLKLLLFLTDVNFICLSLDTLSNLDETGPVLANVNIWNQGLHPFGVGKIFLPLFVLLKMRPMAISNIFMGTFIDTVSSFHYQLNTSFLSLNANMATFHHSETACTHFSNSLFQSDKID